MKCESCGYDPAHDADEKNFKIFFIISSNEDFTIQDIKKIYSCPECGTLKIEV
jgi:predicted RNA-binding Zn-ribbon protein involved in translation (DUF1610 family)